MEKRAAWIAIGFATAIGCGAGGVTGAQSSDAGSPTNDASEADDGGAPLAPDDAGVVEIDAPDGGVSYVLPFVTTSNGIADGFSIDVSIGGGASHEVLLDTGSEALIVPKSALGPDVQTPSPSLPFTYEYTSNGLTLHGEIVMAKVALGVSHSFVGGATSGVPVTSVMAVRVVESTSCDPAYPHCRVPPTLATFGMLGVGFGRDPSVNPSSNALLQVAEIARGAMRPGYVISSNPPRLTVGVPASTAGFARIPLTPGANGDWVATSLPGCVSIPSLAWSLCGSLLLDTGLDYAIVSVPTNGTTPYDGGVVPSNTEVEFLAPNDGSAMTSDISVGSASLQTPPTIEFRHPPETTAVINTGRRVLAAYDYLFDAESGEVGFRKVP